MDIPKNNFISENDHASKSLLGYEISLLAKEFWETLEKQPVYDWCWGRRNFNPCKLISEDVIKFWAEKNLDVEKKIRLLRNIKDDKEKIWWRGISLVVTLKYDDTVWIPLPEHEGITSILYFPKMHAWDQIYTDSQWLRDVRFAMIDCAYTIRFKTMQETGISGYVLEKGENLYISDLEKYNSPESKSIMTALLECDENECPIRTGADIVDYVLGIRSVIYISKKNVGTIHIYSPIPGWFGPSDQNGNSSLCQEINKILEQTTYEKLDHCYITLHERLIEQRKRKKDWEKLFGILDDVGANLGYNIYKKISKHALLFNPKPNHLRCVPIQEFYQETEQLCKKLNTSCTNSSIRFKPLSDKDFDKELSLCCDWEKLVTVIEELVRNSDRVAKDEETEIEITLKMKKVIGYEDFIQIEVQDNGSGIFDTELYKTLKEGMPTEGSSIGSHNGLGLPLIREAISRMGGMSNLYSRYKKGMSYQIFLRAGVHHGKR